jgi:competence protein ComEA
LHTLSKRERWLISGILIIIFLVGLIYTYVKPDPVRNAQSASQNRSAGTTQSNPQDKVANIQVDIKGAVNHPGVYSLPIQSRVADGIRAAGGLSAKADVNSVNLAALLIDGSEIVIPASKNAPDQTTAASISSDGKVDLNTATAAQLDTVPGIGPTRAEQIVQYRETHGLYQSVQDLLNIDGFGQKLLDKIKDKVTVQ